MEASNDSTNRKKQSVNCYRKFKRRLRMQVNWNEWPLRWQMVIHIVTLSAFFSVTYCIFIITITFAIYRNDILRSSEPKLRDFHKDNLQTLTDTVLNCLNYYDQKAIQVADFCQMQITYFYPFDFIDKEKII